MTFTGIPLAALDFYEDLEADNSKAFWTAHKQVYEESVRAPLEALVLALEARYGPAKLFRPYRDVRFSKDKTPYKTHQGAWFGESSRYLQVSAAGLRLAGRLLAHLVGAGRAAAPRRRRRRRRAAAGTGAGAPCGARGSASAASS